MLKLNSYIRIEGTNVWEFTVLHECEIVQDINTLTDTCTIKLPKKIRWEGSDDFGNPPVRRGDKIEVMLGYDDGPVTRFNGYVRSVDAKQPVKIGCEDNMFLLKLTKTEKKAFAKITLTQLIEHLLKGTGIVFNLPDDEIELGNYRIEKNTVAEELAELKKDFGLSAYFIGKVLNVGFTHTVEGKTRARFVFGKNIIEEKFECRHKDDVKLKVKAVSVLKNNTRIIHETGDSDGEQITVYAYDKNKAALEKFAKESIEKYKYTGLFGDFTTFGEPVMNKTDVAIVESSDGNKGEYLLKKITIKFGQGGYQQKLELGQPLKVD